MWSHSLFVFQKYFPKSLIGWKTSPHHSCKQYLSSYTALLSFCLDFGKEGRKQVNSIYPLELEVRASGLLVWWEPWPSGTCRCSETFRSQYPQAPETWCFGSREKGGVHLTWGAGVENLSLGRWQFTWDFIVGVWFSQARSSTFNISTILFSSQISSHHHLISLV